MNIYEIKCHAEIIKRIKRDYAEILQEINIGYPTLEVASLLKRLGELWGKNEEYGYTTRHKNVDLYYILMCIRTKHPALFPSHDLCFFAADELYTQILYSRNDNVEPVQNSLFEDLDTNIKPLQILFNMELLPILILLYRVVPKLTVLVELNHSKYAPHTKEIIENLKEFLPGCNFKFNESKELCLPRHAWVLLQNPQAFFEDNNNFLEALQDIRGGIILSTWNFLGASTHTFNRYACVKSGLLKSVIQLPRPKRQGVDAHPCLIILGRRDNNSSIDLVHIQGDPMEFINQLALYIGSNPVDFLSEPLMESRSVSGNVIHGSRSYNLSTADFSQKPYIVDGFPILANDIPHDETFNLAPVDFLSEPPMDNIIVSADEILHDYTCNLTPAYHLAKSKLSKISSRESQVRLGEVAHVLRCQYTRARVDNTSTPESTPNMYREITLKELDPISGFIDKFGGSLVVSRDCIFLKYIIQPNDIIFAYRGSRNTIGKVGFADVTFNPYPKIEDIANAHSISPIQVPAITSSSLCIIRPFNIDPIWLYYFLQQTYVRKLLSSRASGSNLLAVNIEDVRDILIQIPEQEKLECINKEFNDIELAMAEINAKKNEIRMSLKRLNDVMGQNNEPAIIIN